MLAVTYFVGSSFVCKAILATHIVANPYILAIAVVLGVVVNARGVLARFVGSGDVPSSVSNTLVWTSLAPVIDWVYNHVAQSIVSKPIILFIRSNIF